MGQLVSTGVQLVQGFAGATLSTVEHEFDRWRPQPRAIADAWSGKVRSMPPPRGDWRSAHQAKPFAPLAKRLRRIRVEDLRRVGDPRAAARSANSFIAFVEEQLGMVSAGQRCERAPVGVDERLWIDDAHWIAWTICGDLVSVEELEQGATRGSPEVRRLNEDELRSVFGIDRPVPSVIALYRGDHLDRGSVWRYIAHFDLRQALEAALARAKLAAAAPTKTSAAPGTDPVPVARTSSVRKTRHHPLGNFIAYRCPRPGDDLPPYAVVLQLPPVPLAFPDRRSANRFLASATRLETPADQVVVARVLGSVELGLRFRPGIRVCSETADIVATIRREPRVVLPELLAAWLPRYVLNGAGEWVLEKRVKRGTIRSRWNRKLLQQVCDEGQRVAALIEENAIRRGAGEAEVPMDSRLGEAIRIVQRAERRLPQDWRDQIGLPHVSLGPEWASIDSAAKVADGGHWLRAPVEHGEPHTDGQRRRIVELRIEDLAGLVELAGIHPQLLLVKESTKAPPRWVLPVHASAVPTPDRAAATQAPELLGPF